jgi:hypothetical protein
MRFTLVAVVAVTVMLHLPAAVVSGRVLDATDSPVPGATVRISGPGVSATVVSDPMGRFRFADVPPGPYVLTVSLAGFRTQTLNVEVDSSKNPEWVVTLTAGLLSEVDWVVPSPVDAYRMAAAIAHLRIDGTRRSGPCGDAHAVTSYHQASALRVFKGQVPPTMKLYQEGAGRCSEDGQWYEGSERPYRAGEEYVVFLAARADGYGRLAGPALAFPLVRGGMVEVSGFAGAQRISLNEISELLDRLSRNAPKQSR